MYCEIGSQCIIKANNCFEGRCYFEFFNSNVVCFADFQLCQNVDGNFYLPINLSTKTITVRHVLHIQPTTHTHTLTHGIKRKKDLGFHRLAYVSDTCENQWNLYLFLEAILQIQLACVCEQARGKYAQTSCN